MVLLVALAEASIQLVPDGSIFFHIFLILVMIAVLNRTLFAPITKVLAEREKRGKGSLGQAIEVEERVEEVDRQYREALRSARTAGYKAMQEQRATDLQVREKELETARRETESLVRAEREALARQAENARQQVDSETLARDIRDRVLGTAERT
jgi:F-type H+-transporting ATPase subunit b